MAEQLRKLFEVLLSADNLPWNSALFLPTDQSWTGDSEGAVLDTEDEEDPDHPAFAQAHGLVAVLGMSEVQDIVSNARQQDPEADVSKMLRAFQFYYDNDAFIDFEKQAARMKQ